MLTTQVGIAQTNDPLFPKQGKFNAGVISTYTGNPPPVAIVDVTYGVSKKVSLGLVGGTTGELALAGLRLNTILFQKDNFRGVFRWNAIYYPGRDGKFMLDKSTQHVMPWMFTMGVADAEWKTKNGTRWTLGVGYLETHCIDGMMKVFHLTKNGDDDDDLPLQLYNVIHTGVSIPVSKRIFLRPEVVVVMRGVNVIKKTPDSKVSPYNPYLNLVYTF
jgi:hypothetical protein